MSRIMTRDDLGLPKMWDFCIWRHMQNLAGKIASNVDEGKLDLVKTSGLLNAFGVADHYERTLNGYLDERTPQGDGVW